ncbi:TetR family transcriptional regulator [Agrobacterium radiobacter]|nr:TetR family transcriptional regulator [Agrobacterium tumefaciens]
MPMIPIDQGKETQMRPTTKERLVNAGADRFRELGYSACSVQEIVDQAGVPKGSFYNHFKTKEAFAVEVVANYVASTRRDILKDSGATPLNRIAHHFRHLLESHEKAQHNRGCLIVNLTAETSDSIPLLRETLNASLTDWIDLLSETIREGQTGGEIKSDLEPAKFARFLIDAYEGAVLRMKVSNANNPLENFYSIAMSLLAAS